MVFQISSFDNWQTILYNLSNSGQTLQGMIFCFMLIIGTFFALGLISAVLYDQINLTENQEIKLHKKKKNSLYEESLAQSIQNQISNKDMLKPKLCYTQDLDPEFEDKEIPDLDIPKKKSKSIEGNLETKKNC